MNFCKDFIFIVDDVEGKKVKNDNKWQTIKIRFRCAVYCNVNWFSIKINHLESQCKLQSFTFEQIFPDRNFLLIDERPQLK